MYTNPVYDRDFPDPFVLRSGDRFYAFATHSGGHGFQVMESPDLVRWTHRGTAFTPPWSNEHLWAPEVIRYRDRYYMTYSARNPQTKRHDIGVATAAAPAGLYTHQAILVRGDDSRVGVIDTTVFIDADGTPYLAYVLEAPNRILLRRLAPDLLKVEGATTELVRPDRPWERDINEAPTLLLRNGVYHLFFSVGWFQSNKADASYAVCHAAARSLRGPYVKDPAPLLATVPGKVYGPGHQCLITLPGGEEWLAYHAWDDRNEPRYGSNPAGRTLRIDRLRWQGDTPIVEGPTVTPQPAPAISKAGPG
jgi:beta-xylosidase